MIFIRDAPTGGTNLPPVAAEQVVARRADRLQSGTDFHCEVLRNGGGRAMTRRFSVL